MLRKYSILFISFLLIIACSDDSQGPDTGNNSDNFDRGALLRNVADNIIIPAFKDLHDELILLDGNARGFTQNPNTLSLGQVKTYFYRSYKAWQQVSMFDIGKAEELQFVNHFNIFPVTVADVESNVTSGTYDFNSPNNHDAQGFPAIDYLIFGIGADENAVVAKFTTDPNADGYKKYLTDITKLMVDTISDIIQDWESSYRDEFVASTTNTATSALNKLVNDFIFYYEKRLRANKIGIPAGVFSNTPLPEKVEAFYKKENSKEFALEGLLAVQNFFTGKAFNGTTTGESFKTYLVSLDKASLATDIENQFNLAKTQIETLDDNFFDQVNSNNTEMLKAYDELQKAVVLLKVDMLQAFNVSVDFVDADGD
ncbi:imelysin family protein [uncultured Tenacibaculum sp.]|uniref:imelysin family protein n=1 Tax=uncultured Tenacibaculum sp. TaxID=174713 RepID=UPI00261E4924|nr:imelysin family protein [uncultured Tenacibaculum sp.]